MQSFNRTTITSCLTVLILLLCTFSTANDLKEVVVLNSYHYGFKWTADINEAISEQFRQDESTRLFYEFMDSKRFHSDEYFQTLFEQYRLKYKNHKVDGVICSDNRAFDFFSEHGKEIWGNVPAIFCGVNDIGEQLDRVDSTRQAIVHEIIDVKGTIDLIELLQPELEEIIVISDKTLSGNIFLNQFIEAFDSKHRNYTYRIINNTKPDLLKKALNKIPSSNRAIYLLSLYTEHNGIPNEMVLESQYFFNELNIPLYSNWDFLMPDLIVGGKILKAADQGQLSAILMQQLLNNETIPTHNYPEDQIIIDEITLLKNQLSEEYLPDNILLINEDNHFIERHKKELTIILIILIIFIFIILLLVSDIIKRKSVEISFIDSEKRLELAISGANEGLWDIDLEKKTFFINEQYAKLLEYKTASEFRFNLSNWQEFVFSQDIEQIKEAYNIHRDGIAEVFQCEARLIKKDGSLSWFSIHGKITERINGKPIRITGIILNINNQKAFEKELQNAKEKAEESDRLKSSFLANMSHEIRTPMNAILGFTDLLIYGQLSGIEQNEYLNMIKRSGENLLTLINDIIDISKIESGELKISADKININELIKEVHIVGLSLCSSLNKPVDVRINPLANSSAEILTDPLRVYQILLNLVSNAIKFTNKGFVEIDYSIINDNELKLSVKDSGPGISDEDQKVIFERFRQVDESTIKKHGGTGLGLSITKSLVELMNGNITLISKPRKGSQFIVKLPVKTISSIPTN
ncbi:sensor histidine kinase [Carboxylicivirga marina]|uniref:histidine kinase n=2 Tax=Carboxylicivirga marina TaxID=2800988 RepID=A0ABS1HNG5_9BACT|nr:PAS domain-containing protein [Carboxylicivirga marina]MBK3518985.1 PAS domain-containing protein [Carboxylicivirga marina]